MQTRSVADKASLSDLRRLLRHDLAAAGVAEATTFDCLIAVTEMWTRAGGDVPGDARLAVTWDITSTEARFYIPAGRTKEACKAFHPSRAALVPAAADSVEDLSLALVAGLMDGVEVLERARGRIVCLTKAL